MKPDDLILRPQHPLDPARVLAQLNHAVISNNGEKIDAAVLLAFQVGLRPEFVSPFKALLKLENHHSHEDIVGAMQELRDPSTVDAVYDVALQAHKYLDYDEFFGLARKATWALADIGTADAFARLQLLAASDNSTIAGYAQKRIDRWENERHRKPL